MAKMYKKNNRNVFSVPSYARFWFWWVIGLTCAVFSSVLARYLGSELIKVILFGSWSLVAVLTIWRAYSLTKSVIKAKTIGKYIIEKKAEKAVTKSLLATMSVNRLKDTPYISVPRVTVCDSRPSHFSVEVEKLAGMYDIDKLTEDINSSFRGKLGRYAVTSAMISVDGLFYKFVLEDVASDKTWRPATLKQMEQPSHVLTLQEGLKVNLADFPHIICWGKSGSGKSTTLISLLVQSLMWSRSEIYIVDPKNEFSAMSEFYPANRIAVEIDDVLRMLSYVCDKISSRQKIVADGVKTHQKMGLRAYDLGLSPIVVMADEIGSLVASMDSKQKKEFLALVTQIVQKGRSVSCFAIFGTQSPKTDTTLSSDIRSQFATKILLGSASGENQRMAFDGEVATKGNIERFKGFYVSDGKTEQPMLFHVPDLHSHGLNDLKIIKKAYELGFSGNQ